MIIRSQTTCLSTYLVMTIKDAPLAYSLAPIAEAPMGQHLSWTLAQMLVTCCFCCWSSMSIWFDFLDMTQLVSLLLFSTITDS